MVPRGVYYCQHSYISMVWSPIFHKHLSINQFFPSGMILSACHFAMNFTGRSIFAESYLTAKMCDKIVLPFLIEFLQTPKFEVQVCKIVLMFKKFHFIDALIRNQLGETGQ